MECVSKLEPNDPYALLQQQVPESFMTLQDKVSEMVKAFNDERHPVLNHEEFTEQFSSYFDDEEELNEAVNYLTLQGRVFHYIGLTV